MKSSWFLVLGSWLWGGAASSRDSLSAGPQGSGRQRSQQGTKNQEPRTTNRSGFSLVEVTLAIMVVAVGLMAAFGLFPSGLQASRAALDDQVASSFAQEVFGGYRYLATVLDWDAVPWVGPDKAWPDDTDYVPSLMIHTAEDPSDSNLDDSNRPRPNIGVVTNRIYIAPSYWSPIGAFPDMYVGTELQGFIDHVFRYQLDIADLPNYGGRVKYARLTVWPGEFGTTNMTDARVFYTELFDYALTDLIDTTVAPKP